MDHARVLSDEDDSNQRRVLFVCENPLEVDALVPVAAALEELTSGNVKAEFASQDLIYFLGVDDELEKAGVEVRTLPLTRTLNRSLTLQPRWKKIWVLLRTGQDLKGVMAEYDALVCGVDNGPARVLISEAKQRGLPSFQVVVSLWLGLEQRLTGLGSRLKRIARWPLSLLPGASFYRMPARVAGADCEAVFVIGEETRQHLIREGIAADRVHATGVPRFAPLFQRRRETAEPASGQERPIRMLYIMGSFAWHGLPEHAELQQRQIREIGERLQEANTADIELWIRPHPRQETTAFDWMSPSSPARLLPGRGDIHEVILQCDLVVGIRSTSLLEAVILGRPALTAVFPCPDLLEYREMSRNLLTVRSADELIGYARKLTADSRAYDDLLRRETRAVRRLISPSTPYAARRIAEAISARLDACSRAPNTAV